MQYTDEYYLKIIAIYKAKAAENLAREEKEKESKSA